ncbi:MAG: hypothetical protein DWQ37_06290 [Planctomycetota bacterium]|nr:MAG: hypothetical protein DWQ37_06290 [Planctomycetota bacterium]
MSAVTELVRECHTRGIRLKVTRDGRVTIDAPRDALSPEFLERAKAHKAELIDRFATRAPGAAAKPVCRCGSTAWRDVAIHDGQSTRRDCAGCGRFVDFSRWYGAIALQADE